MSKRFNRRERKQNAPQGDFVFFETEMLLSPAWRALSLNGRRVIERIYIELRKHGGRDNGLLPVTYADFEKHGVKPDYTLRAIAEVVALGFVEVTEEGRRTYGSFAGRSAKYRLTFQYGEEKGRTDDWRHVKTPAEAKRRVAESVDAERREARARWKRTRAGQDHLAQTPQAPGRVQKRTSKQMNSPAPYVGSVSTSQVGSVIVPFPTPHVGSTAPLPTQGVLSRLSVRGAADIFLREVRGCP
jgi:hypothetical protein